MMDIFIVNLSGYMKKMTMIRLLEWRDQILNTLPLKALHDEKLHNYRNKICQLLADKPGEIVVEENGEKVSKKIEYVLDTAFIEDPELLTNESEKIFCIRCSCKNRFIGCTKSNRQS